MKIYQFSGDSKLAVENVEAENGEKIKIKVTHVMPTLSDLNLFIGGVKREYPCIAGHIAIGVISDDRPDYGLKRGTKVILNPYVEEQDDEIKIRGIDCEGFFRDFVFLDMEDFVPFPEDVEEEDAIFVEKIAVALSAINSFSVEKGDYVAIIGAGVIGNILAQLALYFQLIPIVIDVDEHRLDTAKNNGIYYTVNASEDVPHDRVFEITGGRMCEHTVIEDTASVTGAYLFNLARKGGDCTIICEPYVTKRLDADVSMISKQKLNVKGVTDGYEEFNSAINFVAQGILNLEGFIEKKVPVEECEEFFQELAVNPEHYMAEWIEL